MDLTLQLGQEQQLRVSPTLIVLNQLLALSSQELQQLVQQELAQNPALELVEGHPCPTCGTPSVGPLCPFCEQPTAPQATPAPTPSPATSALVASRAERPNSASKLPDTIMSHRSMPLSCLAS